MNNNGRDDRSTNFLELDVNVPRTIGILHDEKYNTYVAIITVIIHVILSGVLIGRETIKSLQITAYE